MGADPAAGEARHPLFARFYAALSVRAEPLIAAHRAENLDGLAGRVLEVGAGNGLNFAHYPATVTEVVAVEPEPYLRRLAADAATAAPVPVQIIDGTAERIPAADGSFDAVVASLVLCSVPDLPTAVAEMHRVLRPGGELRFYEHVASDSAGFRRFQRAADVAWPHLFGGCHTARDTVAALTAAGFEVTDARRFRLRTMPGVPLPVEPHVLGRALRR